MQVLNDNQLHELARKRVDFRAHLITYCVIIPALWVTWYVTGHGYVWPVWPMVGWGIGLIFHFLFDYRFSRLFSEEEEFKKIKKELEEHDLSSK